MKTMVNSTTIRINQTLYHVKKNGEVIVKAVIVEAIFDGAILAKGIENKIPFSELHDNSCKEEVWYLIQSLKP